MLITLLSYIVGAVLLVMIIGLAAWLLGLWFP
jgi:hypothetical protein